MNRILVLGLALVSVGLSGCGDAKLLSASNPPDEMAVVDGPSLALPPNFELRPPKEGEAVSVREARDAQDILLNTNGSASRQANGEKADWLIEKAGGEKRDPNIRKKLSVPDEAEEEEGGFFGNLFGG